MDSLEDYDQVLRAAGYFTWRYGKIDWLESNNEYWLEQDARLRTEFHITTGIQADEIGTWKHKSSMKPVYASAGIPTARCHKVSTAEAARVFLDEIGGYPVIAKPDVGVGAANTYKIEDDAGFEAFFAEKPEVPHVMEEFVEAAVLLMDEPMGALDSFTRADLQDKLLEIRSSNHATMILVTHDVDEAIYLSDRIVIMTPRPGKISEVMEVNLPHPRDRGGVEFTNLRREILDRFHLASAKPQPEYFI